MRHLRLTSSLAALALTLVACGKTSTATSASSPQANASSVITVAPKSMTVALSGTTPVAVIGGTGQYVSAVATQGTLQMTNNTFVYTAPATANSSVVTLTVTDSAGATGSGVVILSGVTGATPSPSSTLVGGTFNATVGTLTGVLTLTQDANNTVGGYLYLTSQNYYYPVVGTVSGNQVTFTDLIFGRVYTATLSSTGGQTTMTGSVVTPTGSVTFTAQSTALGAAPVAETVACGGTYTSNIGGNPGTMRLVHNGAGLVSGYITMQGYYYAVTGSCGTTVSLTNLVTGSSYVGQATFNGQTVSMSGNFTTTDGRSFTWTASK